MLRPSRSREPHTPSVATVSLFSAEEGAAVCGLTSTVHIPFEFLVGERILEAGLYLVGPSDVPGTVTLNRCGCHAPVLVQSIEAPEQGESVSAKLLFYREQDRYFLAQLLGPTITQ